MTGNKQKRDESAKSWRVRELSCFERTYEIFLGRFRSQTFYPIELRAHVSNYFAPLMICEMDFTSRSPLLSSSKRSEERA